MKILGLPSKAVMVICFDKSKNDRIGGITCVGYGASSCSTRMMGKKIRKMMRVSFVCLVMTIGSSYFWMGVFDSND